MKGGESTLGLSHRPGLSSSDVPLPAAPCPPTDKNPSSHYGARVRPFTAAQPR